MQSKEGISFWAKCWWIGGNIWLGLPTYQPGK